MSKYNWIINGIIGFKSISSGLWLTCTWVEHLAQIGGKPFLYSKMENVYFRVKLFNTYNSNPVYGRIKVLILRDNLLLGLIKYIL